MSQCYLTDIQKAMIKKICESISPADGSESGRLRYEAQSLAKFFYSNDNNTEEVIKYMEELGYVISDSDIALYKPDAELSDSLKPMKYSCEVHCYYGTDQEVFDRAMELGFLKVSANLINKATNRLFPQKQTFYVSRCPEINRALNQLVDVNKIRNVRISVPHEIDWNDYYNIQVFVDNNTFELIDFHRIVDSK